MGCISGIYYHLGDEKISPIPTFFRELNETAIEKNRSEAGDNKTIGTDRRLVYPSVGPRSQ